MLPATRQNATGTGCAPCGLGGVKAPATTDSARVTVVSGSLRPISFSHTCPGVPACSTAPTANATRMAEDNAHVLSRLIICRSLLEVPFLDDRWTTRRSTPRRRRAAEARGVVQIAAPFVPSHVRILADRTGQHFRRVVPRDALSDEMVRRL